MMKQSVALTSVLLAAIAAAGCATTSPGSPLASEAAVSRPMSDTTPSSPAENRARVHVDLGVAYFEIGRYDVSLDEARIALNESAGYAPAYHLLGLAYMMIEENGLARQNFEQALRHAPGDPEFNNSYGWFLCTQGEETRGLQRLAQAARNPYYRYAARPYTNAGLCHLRLKDDAAAESQFLAAVQADPSNNQALYQLADIAYRGGRYEQASGFLIHLHRQSDPTSASVWLGLRAERRLGNRDAEASYASQLESRFGSSEEYQKMTQGKYE